MMADDVKQISVSIVTKEDYIQKLSDNADINWTKQTVTVTGTRGTS